MFPSNLWWQWNWFNLHWNGFVITMYAIAYWLDFMLLSQYWTIQEEYDWILPRIPTSFWLEWNYTKSCTNSNIFYVHCKSNHNNIWWKDTKQLFLVGLPLSIKIDVDVLACVNSEMSINMRIVRVDPYQSTE